MKLIPLLVVPLMAMVFSLGMAFPGRPEPPLGLVRGGAAPSGPLIRVGESTGEAVRFLRSLRSDPPPPPPPAPPPPPLPPPPPPPPPDVAVIFRSALRAIARDPETGAYHALIRDPAAPGPQTVTKNVGDQFGDGWRLTKISADAVTLAKGRERRTVRLYG